MKIIFLSKFIKIAVCENGLRRVVFGLFDLVFSWAFIVMIKDLQENTDKIYQGYAYQHIKSDTARYKISL